MAKYCFLLLLLVVSCNKYSEFDTLYNNQEYQSAYELLKKDASNSPTYQERELKVLLFLAIQNTQIYLPLLDDVLLGKIDESNQPWHDLSRAWVRFISAKTLTDYQNIAYLVPQSPFNDNNAEQLRLTIQTHSLLQLKQYQEALAYLEASAITKNSTDLLYIKGHVLLESGQYEEASQTFLRLTSITSNKKLSALAFFYLGNIAIKMKDLDKADEYYLSSWRLNPYLSEVNFQIGRLLQQKKYSYLHSRFYRASLRLNEDHAEAWYYLNI